MEPRNLFQGINSARLCSLAGRYDNPIPPWFLAPIDCLKIPALLCSPTGGVIHSTVKKCSFLFTIFLPPVHTNVKQNLSSIFWKVQDRDWKYISLFKPILWMSHPRLAKNWICNPGIYYILFYATQQANIKYNKYACVTWFPLLDFLKVTLF